VTAALNDSSTRIGVDVGGTNLRVGVVQARAVLWEHRHAADFSQICRAHPPQAALEKIIAELEQAIGAARSRYPDVVSVGIGFPGFIDPVSQVVARSPNLPGLIDAVIAQPLAQRLGLPVIMDNDALAAAYGEYLLSGQRGDSLIYIGLGTGVGGGLVLGGKPYPGQHGVSMEVGHIIVHPGGRSCGCGNRGCLEQYASASGVSLSYREFTGEMADAVHVAALAHQGDPNAVQAFRIAAEALADALAHIQKVLDVAQVVIGGGMNAAWPLMQEAFDARLNEALIPALRGRVQVTLSKAGDQAGMIGAAYFGGN
jgi:glucokinase